jgi:N-acetylglucosamine-6-phosphate deacetylase
MMGTVPVKFAPGQVADLVLVDADFTPQATIVGGRLEG